MAIELNNIERRRNEILPLHLFFSIILLFIFLGTYGYLFISSDSMENKITEKEKEIEEIVYKRRDIEEEVLSYEEKINYFKKILEEHKNILNVFPIVENFSHPYVWFPSFTFDSKTRKVGLLGEAKDLTALGQQIMILKKTPNLQNVSISGIQIKDDGASFSLSFSISPQILKK